jgi:hypothetical protein
MIAAEQKTAPKQTKLLGATVRDLGVIVAVSSTPTRNATRVPTRCKQLKNLHTAAHDLGLETRVGHDRTQYEMVLTALIGKRSTRQASRAEREMVLSAFAEMLAERSQPRPYSAAELHAIVNASSVEDLLGL